MPGHQMITLLHQAVLTGVSTFGAGRLVKHPSSIMGIKGSSLALRGRQMANSWHQAAWMALFKCGQHPQAIRLCITKGTQVE